MRENIFSILCTLKIWHCTVHILSIVQSWKLYFQTLLNCSFFCQLNVLLSLGLVIVMSEALGDDSLFSLLMVATVWEADQFYAVFCKHQVSKTFFPM